MFPLTSSFMLAVMAVPEAYPTIPVPVTTDCALVTEDPNTAAPEARIVPFTSNR